MKIFFLTAIACATILCQPAFSDIYIVKPKECIQCTPGATGSPGSNGATGATGAAGETEADHFFNFTSATGTFPGGSSIPFGATGNAIIYGNSISQINPTTFVLSAAGDYLVTAVIPTLPTSATGSRLTFFLDDVGQPIGNPHEVTIRLPGTQVTVEEIIRVPTAGTGTANTMTLGVFLSSISTNGAEITITELSTSP